MCFPQMRISAELAAEASAAAESDGPVKPRLAAATDAAAKPVRIGLAPVPSLLAPLSRPSSDRAA